MTKKTREQLNCTECNLQVKLQRLAVGEKAMCPRCGCILMANHAEAFERILAFAIAALILLFLSLSFDFVSLHYQGQVHTIRLLDTYFILHEQNYLIIALLLVITIIAFPLIVLCSLLYLIFFINNNHYPLKGLIIARVVLALLPWSMAEIFLIGVLVSLIKISTMANVSLGLSFYAYVLFSICYIAAIQFIDKQNLINKLMMLKTKKQSFENLPSEIVEEGKSSKNSYGNVASIQQTWALLITSFFLYFPANLLPIMTTRSLGKEELNTILGGVIVLWQSGSYPIAIVIFIASIVVPVIKFVVLAWLNYSVQQQSNEFQLQRAQLYRITEFIGRWSMIDIFAVAILSSLIQLGTTMTIHPGHAAMAFCGVVILTMFAANTFDSTLIWKKKTTL